MQTELSCGIVAGGKHSALLHGSADCHRNVAQGRVASHFDGSEKAVHIDMDDFTDQNISASGS
jgi:hypothetical protein